MISAEWSGEANISTEQQGSQASARISIPHGHAGWSSRDQPAAGQGTQGRQRLTLAMRDVASDGICRLKRRGDFLAVAKGAHQSSTGVLLQGRRRVRDAPDHRSPGTRRPTANAHSIRVGFTCSRKLGNAVRRNRAKRRLREAARQMIPKHGRRGWDYVLVGRVDATLSRPWQDLLGDLEWALGRLHRRADLRGRGGRQE